MEALEDELRAALHEEARPRFEDTARRATALAADPDLAVDAATFAAELARRVPLHFASDSPWLTSQDQPR